MAVLKRFKGATLMETMVATVLIVIIFMMASLVMEATFVSRINNTTEPLSEKFHKLEYGYVKGGIGIPYFETWEDWDIEMLSTSKEGIEMIVLTAKNRTTQKEVTTYMPKAYEDN